MQKTSCALAIIAIVAITWAARGQAPATAPATQAATQLAARRLGIHVMDARHYKDSKDQVDRVGGNLWVNGVEPGRAQRMGMRDGDVIKQVNGQPMQETQDVVRAVRENDFLAIDVLRNGYPVKLVEPPTTQPH